MKILLPIILAVTVVMALVLAGCVTQPAGEITDIRIGYQPSTHQVAEMIAMEKGWWQQDLAPYGVKNITDYRC